MQSRRSIAGAAGGLQRTTRARCICRRDPRAQGLREWPAFKECRKIIEEFLEQLPLFQMLAHRAVRPRHWADIARLTGARAHAESMGAGMQVRASCIIHHADMPCERVDGTRHRA